MSYYNGPTIVTNGLAMYLDAGNRKSYLGSGNTWGDLSGNGNNATLTNGPTFDGTAAGGGIVFNGTNHYAIVNDSVSISPTTGLTIISWTKSNSYGDMTIVGKNDSYQNQTLSTNGIENSIYNTGNTWVQPRTATGLLSNTRWNCIAITYTTSTYIQRTYLNGAELVSNQMPYTRTGVAAGTINDSANNLYIGSWIGSSEFFNGTMSSIFLYNRALTESELLQNYNATKGRFGL